MIRKTFLAVFVLILVANNVFALQQLKSEDGVSIPLVADKMTEQGEIGEILNAQVIVTNGTGHVFVDTNPYTQVDLQGSARLAAMVATDVLGVDEKLYDFYYIIDIGSPIIGGPSAGGALTVATIAAINHWDIKQGIVMTGMIDPDESIGPVGGIPYKLQAAATNNTSLFLVPQGQLVVNQTTMVRIGNVITSQTQENTIDLKELGNKLNVTVKEVSTIQDAVLIFTGHDISKPSSNETVYTSNYLKLLEHLASQLTKESRDMYKDISFMPNSTLKKNIEQHINKADELVNNKQYYAATSLYFEAMIDILTLQWSYDFDRSQNKGQYLTNLTNTVEKQIKDSENDLNNFKKSNGISDVEVIGAAESRIMLANATLEGAKRLQNVNDIISALAFSYERAKTVQWWLTLATPSEKTIPEEILKERAGWYISQGQSIGTYVQALLAGSGPIVNHATIGDMTLIQNEMDRGYYSGAIFDSLQTISRLSAVIGMGIQDPSSRINQSASSAQDAINEARSKGIEPTLAISAYEYAGMSNDPIEKISQYSYAKMIAKTTESLYARATIANTTTEKNATIPAQTKKSPGLDIILDMSILIVTIMLIKKLRK